MVVCSVDLLVALMDEHWVAVRVVLSVDRSAVSSVDVMGVPSVGEKDASTVGH